MGAATRRDRFMPGGVPRYLHIYDNGGATADRYTIVFTGRYRHKTNGSFIHQGASADPFYPQGIGEHGESTQQIDYPKYGHLGKKIQWADLPVPVQSFALSTYCDLWDLTPTKA